MLGCFAMNVLGPIADMPSTTLPNLLALSSEQLCRLVADLGWPRYRATQILQWLYQHRVRDIRAMTNLPLDQRATLCRMAAIERASDVQCLVGADGTRKFLWSPVPNLSVETILIPEGRRLTLCVSSQIGCTLDCSFCLTGQMGWKRNLRAHEIVEQVLIAQDHLLPPQRITSLVFMGMGEPLANIDAVSEAIGRLTNAEWGLGFSPRRITLSTAGMVARFADIARLGVNLAVSLNATTDEQRQLLMPAINRLYPLEQLIAGCREYSQKTECCLTIEYVMLAGVNDTMHDARRLVQLLRGIRCKVNLIPFNEFASSSYRRPNETVVRQFQAVLRHAGFDVFVRKSRGSDILGACGQLGYIPRASAYSRVPTASAATQHERLVYEHG
ncbi:MAG: 23S rRNA (adenine(2503)-C(2))-methyltransferase RlmN [Nitrospirae bacterium]|nr:MAG: 23S rRNA (adenine(2503)-C(2))-methyltransferase RlmN [Nitrospirota bacterium]